MPKPPFATVDEWLDWQWQLHPQKIELGLTRVQTVAVAMGVLKPAHYVISIAGTNGKGSSAALIEQTLLAAGHSVAVYSSPHLLSYNERLRINGKAIDDARLCTAFACVEQARREQTLSYFEFGSLAAFKLIKQAKVDVAVLEVGLGGRLDAVNVIDADIALITNIGLDHQDWLGDSREKIAVEKAGIMRKDCPVICNDPEPPRSIAQEAQRHGALLLSLGKDYQYIIQESSWQWHRPEHEPLAFRLPEHMRGSHFVHNAAGVFALLQLLPEQLVASVDNFVEALGQWRLAGRCEWRNIMGNNCLLDVAHNVESVSALTVELESAQQAGGGKILALFAALQDKPITEMLVRMAPHVDAWYFAGLPNVARAAAATQIQAQAEKLGISALLFDEVSEGWRKIQADARLQDCIVVFGSFHTVEAVLRTVTGDFNG